MKEIDNTEQWLLNGDCDKCRRSKYCTKECTRAKRATASNLHAIVAKAMIGRLLIKSE